MHREAKILILCKTYPSPSARYAETSCVAGIEDTGKLVRLYPVPFRLIADTAKFKKWQWITAKIEKTNKDHRAESHRIGVDTIVCAEQSMDTSDGWAERRTWLAKNTIFGRFAELEAFRTAKGVTLGLLRPHRVLSLEITPCAPDWTDEEKKKLIQLQQQGSLFDSSDAASIAMLRKLPFDFHYHCQYMAPDGSKEDVRHKIADWEAGALYWNVVRQHGINWEAPFRQKMEYELPSKDLMFLMGTIHRFPDQWLITSLIYPPKQPPERATQLSLL